MMNTEKKPTDKKGKKNDATKDKATSGGGKDVNDGGAPASKIKHGKGETSGSKGTQA